MDTFSPCSRLRFVIVNSFTCANLLLGVLAVIAAGTGLPRLAAWGLLACVILDACDGNLARRWRVASTFGTQFDSLADMTSFVIAGMALTFYWLAPEAPLALIAVASALYAVGGAIRLARYNCTGCQNGYFQGIPTTFVAAIVALYYLTAPALAPSLVIGLVILLAGLMVSLLPYPRPELVLRRCPPWLVLPVGVGFLLNPAGMVQVLSLSYVGLGPGIWLYRRTRRAR